MKRFRGLALSIFLFFSSLMFNISSCSQRFSMPNWLGVGVYAVYRFSGAYGFEESPFWSDEYGWILTNFGPGYYRWEVSGVNGSLVTLQVTLSTEKWNRAVEVILNAETMDLVEDGKIWGKAWFWIDSANLSPTSENTVVRNTTFCRSWLNMTFSYMRVSRIYSQTRESNLKPIETKLGLVDLVITVSGWIEGLKNLKYKVDHVIADEIIVGSYGLSSDYDAKSGLLLYGTYIDDILTQKFGIHLFEEMTKETGKAAHWLLLEDTNIPIDVSGGGVSALELLKGYYPYILIGILISLFIITFIASRRRG